MHHRARSLVVAVTAVVPMLTLAASPAQGQVVRVSMEQVAGPVHMLTGQGGNIGVCVGADGVFMIDDQFAPLTERILATIGEVSDAPVRFVVNTHWHGDHTGGNENLGSAGAIIVAHDNVRKRMTEEQFLAAFNQRVQPAPAAALPVVTFADAVTFHWNGETIDVMHVDPAHTDGDSIVHFRGANVIHTGDIFFNGMYPFIDTSTGGNLPGMVAAVDRILAHCAADTRVIPGHGPLASVDDLRRYRGMLATVHERIAPMVHDGKSRDEVIAAKPTKDLDETWGGGFMQPDAWVGIVYDGYAVVQHHDAHGDHGEHGDGEHGESHDHADHDEHGH